MFLLLLQLTLIQPRTNCIVDETHLPTLPASKAGSANTRLTTGRCMAKALESALISYWGMSSRFVP